MSSPTTNLRGVSRRRIYKKSARCVDLTKKVPPSDYGVDEGARAIMNRHFSRAKEFEFFEQLKPCMVGMVACSSLHYWGRMLEHVSGT